MKKLTMKMIETKAKIANDLSPAEADLFAEIRDFNDLLEEHTARIEAAQGRYNEVIDAANVFMLDVQVAQEAYQENRSDAWQDSDNGYAYKAWADEWSQPLEEIDICFPDPVEEPEMDAVALFRDLPEYP
jgi:hypothetical protein